MKRTEETIEVRLAYDVGRQEPAHGVFEGGVVSPEHTDELMVWVDPRQQFDESLDDPLLPMILETLASRKLV